MSNDSIDQKLHSRRPKDTKFKQQKLPAWQPILTANTVLPLLFAIGVSFIPLGIGFLITANNVREKLVDYTTTACVDINGNGSTCAEILAKSPGYTCYCYVNFSLDVDFQGPVMMYYSLTNFYQNHRRYVKSRDDNQLNGADVSLSGLSSDCDPFRFPSDANNLSYAPCGAIANSMFNDTLSIRYHNNSGSQLDVGLLSTGIAWTTDVTSKFANPALDAKARNVSVHPRYWQKSVWELNGNSSTNNGFVNEDLIVWMRTAALPTFRKLYRRIDHRDEFLNKLPAGNYTLRVAYTFPVTDFGGTKRMILSTTSWLGGRNPFLGLAYIIVGTACLVMGCIFLLIHLRIGKRSKKRRPVELTVMTPYYDPSLNMEPISAR